MIVPSAANIKARFPEFSEETDAAVEFAVEEAQRKVDSTWVEKDQTLALSYLAAHYLMVGIQRRASASGQVIKSETIGRMVTTYESTVPSLEDYGSTFYGIRFREMARLNFSGGLIV